MRFVGKTVLHLLVLPIALSGQLPNKAHPEELVPDYPFEWYQEHPHTLQEAFVSLYWDKQYVSEILCLVSWGGDLVRLRYWDVKNLLDGRVDEDFLEALSELQDLRGWLDLDELEIYGPEFDLEDLTLALFTPASDRDLSVIQLQSGPIWNWDDMICPDEHSAYLNLHHLGGWSDGEGSYLLDLEGAYRFGEWVAEGRGSYQKDRTYPFDWRDLRLVRDFPCALARLSIGEDQSFRPRVLTSDRIHGVKYSTEFRLQPSLITDPVSEYSFLLERDSLVEVWVNGAEVDLLRLSAGPYDVRNFPLTLGFNEVLLKIRDDLGREETLTFNAVTGPNLLAPGWKEFAYSLGVEGSGREIGDDVVLSLFYRRGVNEQWTTSFEERLGSQHQAISFGQDFAHRYFFGSLDTALSHSQCYGTGGLARLVLGRLWGRVSLNLRLDAQTQRFLNQRQNLGSERPKYSAKCSLSAFLGEDWGNVDFNWIQGSKWSGSPVSRIEATWEKHWGRHWRVNLTAFHARQGNPKSEFRVQVNYNLFGDEYHRHHVLQASSRRYSVRNTLGGGRREGWPADWKFSHYHQDPMEGKPTESLNASIDKDYSRFGIHYGLWMDEVGGENLSRHNFSVHHSLAYTGGELVMGLPVDEAFAIIRGGDVLESVPLRACTYPDASYHTGTSMGALHPHLRAYYPTPIYVEPEKDGVDLEQRVYTVFPKYKSGVTVAVGETEAKRGGILEAYGILLDDVDEPVAMKALLIFPSDHPDAEPYFSFTNARGLFRLHTLAPGARYRIEVIREPDLLFEFEVPSNARVGEPVNLEGRIFKPGAD